MTWTDSQRAELAREYARVDYRAGDRWPAPPEETTPADLLALFKTIPDGAGLEGYAAALARRSGG